MTWDHPIASERFCWPSPLLATATAERGAPATMSTATVVSNPLDLLGIGRAVGTVLEDFLSSKASMAAEDQLPADATRLLHSLLAAGGKRLSARR
jgi:hypothetical protein